MKENAGIEGLRITPGGSDAPGGDSGPDEAVPAGDRQAIAASDDDAPFLARLVERAQRLEAQLAAMKQEQERIARAIALLEPLRDQYARIIGAEREVAREGIELDGPDAPDRAWPWQR